MTRRSFLLAAPLLLSGLAAPRRLLALAGKHPEPRPGINASKVLTREQIGSDSEALRIFDLVRQIPGVVDGIKCYCGCDEIEGYYSLLSCYEGDGMARYCVICSGEGELAARLHKEGRTLDQIRAAIDAKFA